MTSPEPEAAAIDEKLVIFCQSRQVGPAIRMRELRSETCHSRVRRPGSPKGSGCRNAASTVVNISAVLPMPIASVAMATSEKAGARRSARTASRKSRTMASM